MPVNSAAPISSNGHSDAYLGVIEDGFFQEMIIDSMGKLIAINDAIQIRKVTVQINSISVGASSQPAMLKASQKPTIQSWGLV